MKRATNLHLIALTLATLILSACGGQTFGTRSKYESSSYSFANNYNAGNISSPATPSSSPTPLPTTAPYTGLPPYQFKIEGVGYKTYHVTVQANRVLKVKFRPGINSKYVEGTKFTPRYSQLGVYIGVTDYSEPTEILNNGLTTGQVQTSSVIDFSSKILVSGNAVTDRHEVEIIVNKPNNDYWCLNFMMYCSWTNVWDTHPWNGTLLVQTDDTDPI